MSPPSLRPPADRASDSPFPPATNGPAWPAAELPADGPHPAGSPAGRVPVNPAAAEPFGSQPTESWPQMHVSAPVQPGAAGQPPSRRRKARSGHRGLAITAVVLGIAGLVASLVGLIGQALPRQLSPRQQEKITAWEVASRWRTWPAGKVFPASVSYALPPTLFEARSGLTMTAHRVGIARQSTCAAALDRGLARALGRDGCEGVLRATYTDSTGSFVATVAVVVMHGQAPSLSSLPAGHGPPPGVRAVPFRGTLAARFGNRQRQITGASARGSYLILYTAGYADGRGRDRVSSNPYASSEMKDLGAGLDRDVGRPLGAPPPTPRCPGAPGC
jgi:hypothetical protein